MRRVAWLQVTRSSSDDRWQVRGAVTPSITLHRGRSVRVLPERMSSAWKIARAFSLVQTDEQFMLVARNNFDFIHFIACEIMAVTVDFLFKH